MDRAAKKCVKMLLKLVNSVMALTGIAILMYSVWMIVVCRRSYPKYPYPWFLWACIGTGTIFCSLACIGHIGAGTRKQLLLDLYIGLMFLFMLVEGLITADICINDDWDEDFPKDHTKRFKKFVDYVEDHANKFKCLGLFIAFSQVSSFLLAIVLRTMRSTNQYRYNNEDEANLPLLSHQIQPLPLPMHYAIGHPADQHFYPQPPYAHAYGYSPDVSGNEKTARGEYVDGTPPAAPKGC